MPVNTYSSDELIRFIEAAGESTNIDAKGPMEWDGGEASAGLTKDILALANSRDGGVIVVGKQEPQPGKFVLAGVSESQAASFETTKVATWVNNHCSPPVSLVCYRLEHQSLSFIVIAVSEFHDVPVICTKQYEIPSTGKANNVLLRKGVIYVRTANAESAPLSSVEEMRQLIGLATTKRADQMLGMFQAMLKGRPLLPEKPHEELFQAELTEVQAASVSDFGDQANEGAWTFSFHPVRYLPTRWEEMSTLKSILSKSVIRIGREFPPIAHGTQVREWGVYNQLMEDAFGITRSGLFLATRLFRENTFEFKKQWQSQPDIPAGGWLDLKRNISLVIEFFLFMSRVAENIEAGEEVAYEVVAGPLTGRRLATIDRTFPWLDPTEPCRASSFRRKKVVTVEALRASWEEECATVLYGFFELFSGVNISKEWLIQAIGKFKERKF